MKTLLRVGNGLQPFDGRHGERHRTVGISRGEPQGLFVDQQPGLLHTDRNHRNGYLFETLCSGKDLFDSLFKGHAFSITMDKQDVARVQIQCPLYSLAKAFWRFAKPAKVGPGAIDRHAEMTQVLLQ
jgi:hypothetical protein